MDLVLFARMSLQNAREKLRKAYFRVSSAPFDSLRNTFSRSYHDCFDHYCLFLMQTIAQPTSNVRSKADLGKRRQNYLQLTS